jgi:hypothetical protein
LVVVVEVNVTGCPNVLGFCDDVTVVVVAAWLTVCCACPWLGLKLVSPEYVAVSVFTPGVRLGSTHCPAATVAVHELTPSVTVTFPVGVPPPGGAAVTEYTTV